LICLRRWGAQRTGFFESEIQKKVDLRLRGFVAGSLLVLWINFWITYAEFVVYGVLSWWFDSFAF
jgi:hypothetical protein